MKPADAMIFGARNNLLRGRGSHEQNKVTFVELFFDLVFVFAVTQLSHSLLDHLNLAGALQTALLLMAVWWVWIFTSWFTNWLDPQATPVRVALFLLMLAGLVLSISIPDAFGARGASFAIAYVLMQVGRNLFMVWAMRGHSASNYRNFQRISSWFLISAIFWIGGIFVQDEQRFALWALALVIEYTGPSCGFFVPGLGRSGTADWDVEGAHLAERCALFIIIALGESVLVTGATFAKMDWTIVTAAAFVSAFLGSVAMWWIYFNVGAERASEHIAASSDPGRYGRAYTYTHLLPVAGIIVTAVSDELVLAHPQGHVDFKTAATTLVGPALFLIGNLIFKRILVGSPALSHMIGLGLLALAAPLALVVSPLVFSLVTTAILVLVAAQETWSIGGKGAQKAAAAPEKTRKRR